MLASYLSLAAEGNESGSVCDMKDVQKVTSAVSRSACVAAFALVAGMTVGPATAHADGHQVTYTITATGNLTGNVRYMNSDPATQAAFDANSSQFMTTAPATFSAGQPLVYTSTLSNPNQWAYINASGGCHWPDCGSGATPELHCEIAVDGQVVTQQTASTVVTCTTRPW
jgi:hypothetical protein